MKSIRMACMMFACLVSASGCVTFITMDRLQAVHTGVTVAQLHEQLEMAPLDTLSFTEGGIPYALEIYPMQTGTTTVMTTQTSYYGNTSYTRLVPQQVPVTADYGFLFDDKALIFWGFIEEFGKSDNPIVLRLSPVVSESYLKWKHGEDE